MPKLTNDHTTKATGIILVADVFGKTPALKAFAKEIKAESIIDPYDGLDMAFNNEADAYAYFTEKVGLDAYFTLLVKAINSFRTAKQLIGFSVGASVIWRLSATITSDSISSATCFYGSQIRNFTDIEPKFPIRLIQPKSEPHFDVIALQAKITTKKDVNIINTTYLHGFMNPHSVNYNQKAFISYVNLLRLPATYIA